MILLQSGTTVEWDSPVVASLSCRVSENADDTDPGMRSAGITDICQLSMTALNTTRESVSTDDKLIG
jgi:hypothetical protein